MTKTKLINKILSIVCVSIFLVSLIIFIFNFKNLPSEVGSHFGPDGDFDTYKAKSEIFWIFYPYFVTSTYIAIFEIASLVVSKIKTGLIITEKHEEVIKSLVIIVFGIIKLTISLFYSCFWAYAVGTQSPINTRAGKLFAIILIVLVFSLAFYFLYLDIRYNRLVKWRKKHNKN